MCFQAATLPYGSNREGGRSLTVGGSSGFLTDTPQNMLDNGALPEDLPLVAGVVENEGTFLTAATYGTLAPLGLDKNFMFLKFMLLPAVLTSLGMYCFHSNLSGYTNDNNNSHTMTNINH